MNNEIIEYGHNVHDPWGLLIAIYLFAGGMSAGLILSMSIHYLKTGKSIRLWDKIDVAYMALILIVVGSLLLLFDLRNIKRFYQLFLHFDTTAPMSWGAWVLMLNIVLVGIWILPELSRFFKITLPELFTSSITRKIISRIAIPASIGLAAYTGFLLNMMVSKPLWYSPYLPAIFTISGVSTGIVLISAWGMKGKSKAKWIRADLILILFEIIFIGVYIFDLFTGTDAQVTAVRSLIYGQVGFAFWLFVLLVGLLIPLFLEIRELSGKRIPKFAVPVLVLLGGFVLRFLIIYTG